MKKLINSQYFKWGLTALIVLILCICFIYLIFMGDNISGLLHALVTLSMPVIDGFAIAFIATPVLNGIEQRIVIPFCYKMKWNVQKRKVQKRMRAVSLLFTMLIIIVTVYGFFSIVIKQFIPSIQSIIFQFPVYINNLITLLDKVLADNPEAERYIANLLSTYSADLDKWLDTNVIPRINDVILSVSMSVISVLKALYNLIIGFIISVYILSSKEKFASQAKKIAYALLEREHANQLIESCRFVNRTFIGFLSGKIIDSIIIGILCYIGVSIMKMPYAVLISVIIGVTNIIPFFGPYIGAIPSALLILVIEPVKCLPFIIFILALQQLDGNVIGPKILGNSTGLTGFWVIFSITIFGGMWGILGMLIGVPFFAVLYACVRDFTNRLLKKRSLSTSTSDYAQLDYIDEEDNYIRLKGNILLKESQSKEEKGSTQDR